MIHTSANRTDIRAQTEMGLDVALAERKKPGIVFLVTRPGTKVQMELNTPQQATVISKS